MFLKIKLRQLLLIAFEGTRFGTNPYSLHPLANYVYYDAMNDWLPVLKQMKKDGADNQFMIEQFVKNVISGVSADKFYKAAASGESYNPDDLIDDSLLNLIDSLTEGEERLPTLLYGCVAGLRMKM